MNVSTPKAKGGRARRMFDWLMSDWLWEVCLILVVTPVVVDSFLSMGTSSIV